MEQRVERIVWVPPTHAVIVSGDTLVQIWEHAAPAAAFQAIRSHCERRARETPGRPLWMLALSASSSPMPDGEARAISATFPEFFSRFALVIEGSGFRAAAGRAVMASMSMMSSQRTRPFVTATVGEASAWLERESEGAVRRDELERLIASERAALAAG